MGRAEDLLNDLQNTNTNNGISLLIAGENTDTEPHFIISDNRVISVPSELRTIAVQYDHNIETVTFDCPRYWDGHDMSKMVVYINYERADGETGAYLADNVRVDDEDESIMHFEWTISRNVTSTPGSVTFLVCIKSVDKSGDEQEHWNSERCSDISVAPGLETGEPIEEKYPDVLTQLADKVENISKSNATINDEESSTTSTYSSNKIDDLVSEKADSSTVTQLSSKVGSLETTVGTKADKTQVDTLSGTVSELSTKVDSAVKINDSAIGTDSTYSSQKIESLVGTVDTKVGQINTKVEGIETDISELETSVTELSGDLTALETQVSDIPSINDETPSATSLYSSQKINSLVSAVDTKVSSKADQSALTALQSTVGTKADQTELDALEGTVSSLQSTVDTKAGINDSSASATSTYSSNKINTLVSAKADSTTVTQLSSKVDSLETTVGTKADQSALTALETKVDGKPSINDSEASATSVYSSNKVDDLLNEISTGSGSVPPGGTAGQVLRKSSDNSIIEWSTIIDDSKSATNTSYSSSKIEQLVSNAKTELETDISELTETVGTKADTTTVTQLSSKVSSLETTVNSKAGINDSQASATSTYSSNKINSLVGGKADNAAVTELSSKVGSLETTVGTKANQSELDTLEETVSTLQTTVSSKADQTALTALQSKVDAKPNIDDSEASATSVYSSNKVDENISSLISDTTTTANNTWSAQKIKQNTLNSLAGVVVSRALFTIYQENTSNSRYLDLKLNNIVLKDTDIVIVSQIATGPKGQESIDYGNGLIPWAPVPGHNMPDNVIRLAFAKPWVSNQYYNFQIVLLRFK